MTADLILFNSKFNMDSFLNNIDKFLKVIPDHRPKNIKIILEPKSKVLYFPLDIPQECKIVCNFLSKIGCEKVSSSGTFENIMES